MPHSPTASTARSRCGRPTRCATATSPRSTSRSRAATRCAPRPCASPPSAPPAGSAAIPTAQSRSESVAWFGAVARLAANTVGAGLVAPAIRDEREMTVARWVPVPDDTVSAALDGLAAAMPPVCAPAGGDESAIEIHAALVDAVARTRLADRGWRPALPPSRSPAVVAARSAFNALAAPDPALLGSALAHPDELHRLATRFDRHRRRLRGEPVVVHQVRLVLPDDLLDDWEVRLELVDELDPGRWCTADDVWDGTPIAVDLAGGDDGIATLSGEVLALARTVAECIDVAAELLVATEPSSLLLTVEEVERFLEQAPAELAARRHRPARARAPRPRRRRRPWQRHAVRRRRPRPPLRARGDRRLAARRRRRRRPGGDHRGRARPRRARRGDAAAHRPPLGAHRPGGHAPGARAARRAPPRPRRRRRRHAAAPRRRRRGRRRRRSRQGAVVDRRAARRPPRRAARRGARAVGLHR